MKVIYTDEALRDLDEILTFIASNYPSISTAFQKRRRSIERCIGRWPMSAEEVTQRPGVSLQNLLPVTSGAVEILHIHHAARHE
jgi:hypothetical protein